MSARIVIDLMPSGEPGKVVMRIASEVTGETDGLSMPELVFALQQAYEGLQNGTIKPEVTDGMTW